MTAVVNPKNFTWTDPTTNTDGSAITAGEILGYTIGVRLKSTGQAGEYATTLDITSASAASEAISAISPPLPPGDYMAAIMTKSVINSGWSTEVEFEIAAVPNPPSNFSVA